MTEKMGLSVGDQVEVMNLEGVYNSSIEVGMHGKVIHIGTSMPQIGVHFEQNIDGHNCDKSYGGTNCWYINETNLVLVDDHIRSLYKTKWVELCERVSKEDGNYIFIREPWLIDAKAVSVLPYRFAEGDKGVEFLLRCENADVSVTGTVKGGCDKEDESTVATAVRELLEEAGYHATEDDMVALGTARSSKLNTTTMHLFAVDVTGLKYTEPVGDGTLNEANAYCEWVDYRQMIESQDPMVHISFLRFGLQMGFME
jgi:8-oxo-dGTP pyrophosphatase MutT (NUDIX family)